MVTNRLNTCSMPFLRTRTMLVSILLVIGYHHVLLSHAFPISDVSSLRRRTTPLHCDESRRTARSWFLPPRGQIRTTALCMSKGLNKVKNRQADLKRKMELAKKQKEDGVSEDTSQHKLSEEEVKDRNDRMRFETLLQKQGATVLNDIGSDGYLTKEQEEAEIRAARSGVERLFEGDRAPTDCFEELVSIKSENAIGKRGAERLVPWLRKNPDRQSDYIVVLTDPRMKSPELRQAVEMLKSELPAVIYQRLIVINADSPAENRRWLKKSGLVDKVDLYSDEKMEWMRAYTVLGENRWSMTVLVLAEERVEKIARDVDIYGVSRTVVAAVKGLDEARL